MRGRAMEAVERCRPGRSLAVAALSFVLLTGVAARDAGGAVGEGARATVDRLLAEDPPVLVGREGWLYLTQELRALAAPAWRQREGLPAERDPLPAIVDFRDQLRGAGIELVVVLVPPKVLVVPEPLFGERSASVAESLGQELAALQGELARQGVTTLDLLAPFARSRSEPARELFCQTDSHWSPRGIALAARLIGERLGTPSWIAGVPRRELAVERREVAIDGDLGRLRRGEPSPREVVEVEEVLERRAGALVPLVPWRESPVLLLGESHVLVFHAGGDLHTRGAGLPEHLALALGFPVDVVGVRGSGGTPSRVNLMRRGDALAGKRVVIWVLAARELLAGSDWRRVPVVRR